MLLMNALEAYLSGRSGELQGKPRFSVLSEQVLQSDLQTSDICVQKEIMVSCIGTLTFMTGTVSHEKVSAHQLEMRSYGKGPSQSYSGFIVPALRSIHISGADVSLRLGKKSPSRPAQVIETYEWSVNLEIISASLEGHPESGCQFYQEPSVILFPFLRIDPNRKGQRQNE